MNIDGLEMNGACTYVNTYPPAAGTWRRCRIPGNPDSGDVRPFLVKFSPFLVTDFFPGKYFFPPRVRR